MEQLGNVVERLRQFDRWRSLAARRREDGCQTLLRSLSSSSTHGGLPWPALTSEHILEKAEVLKALLACHGEGGEKARKSADLTNALEDVGREKALQDGPDHVPVLRAAKALCALAAAPDSAFSGSVMYFMYAIVREIFVVRPPEWTVGGAGAGDGLSPNGFVTWQCVRAVSDFQKALEQTAALITEIAAFVTGSAKYLEAYARGKVPANGASEDPWEVVDEERRVLSFITSVQQLRANIALKLDSLDTLDSGEAGAVLAFIARIRADLQEDIHKHCQQFETAARQIEAHRGQERVSERIDAVVRNRIRWSETAHTIAYQTVKDAASYARRALNAFRTTPDPTELHALAGAFTQAAQDFHALLRAVNAHVSRSLDTQLAAAALPGPGFEWDPGEMAFAAAAYVETSPVDERVRRAARYLLDIMGETGVFPLGNPVRTTEHQYTLHAQNPEVIRALAVVLEKADDVPLDPAHAERMLAYLSDEAALSGWISGTDGVGPRSRRVVAATVLALSRVCRMLDERINKEVFRFFSVKHPAEIQTQLHELFYPDYGLVYVSRSPTTRGRAGTVVGSPSGGAATASDTASAAGTRTSEKERRRAKNGIYRKESIAVVLERMRAHVRRAPVKGMDATFSLVLHGPPGTGKTTLVESLARTCGVPLVEVTPSDIVIGGAEKMEARARAVFEALSLLTRVVILFDEFDPVILKRRPEEKNPSVFSFLTPGMLPKLKKLHERAEKRAVAYVLVTNIIAKLDDAAIREGRFDLRMGIYPPDVLSRYGRLRDVARRYARANGRPEDTPADDRIWDVVRTSGGGSMTTMGKPGWFSLPRGNRDLRPDKVAGYLFDPTVVEIPKPPVEARLSLPALPPDPYRRQEACKSRRRATTPAGKNVPEWCRGEDQQVEEDHATREYKEWAWVVCWDHQVREAGSGATPRPASSEQPADPTAAAGRSPADAVGPEDALSFALRRLPDPGELERCFCAALEELLPAAHRGSGITAPPGSSPDQPLAVE